MEHIVGMVEITVYFKGNEAKFELPMQVDSMSVLKYHIIEKFQELAMYDFMLKEYSTEKRIRSLQDLHEILASIPDPSFKIILNLNQNLRVGSYNLANFSDHKNWSTRVKRIAEFIRASECDVVGLQEVRYDSSQCNFIASMFKAMFRKTKTIDNMTEPHMLLDLIALLPEYNYYRWQPVMEYSGSRIEGLGIISKLPITTTHFQQLPPAVGDRNIRGVFHVVLEHDSGPFDVFVTHLTYDPRSQDAQAMQAIQYATSRQSHRVPQILLGDFNVSQAYEKPCLIIEGKKSENGVKGNWTDAWRATTKKYGGRNDVGNTFRSWKRRLRYDRIYCRGPYISPVQFQISGLATSQDDSASDH